MLVVDDAATGIHPEHVARLERALVAIMDLSVDHERHSLQPRVWMGTADCAAHGDVEPIVHQEDEWIAGHEIVRVEYLDRRVAGSDESGRGRRRGDDTSDGSHEGSPEESDYSKDSHRISRVKWLSRRKC